MKETRMDELKLLLQSDLRFDYGIACCGHVGTVPEKRMPPWYRVKWRQF